MKIFEHRNTANPESVCPVCKTNDDGKTVLIGIAGTEEGGNMEAVQVHVDCIQLYYYPGSSLIAQKI